MGRIEEHFDASFATALALREKQIQQNYRPIIGVHKWFARRPGSIFRCLLLAEFNGSEPLATSYWRAHDFRGAIADPFMGGGTPVFEANRLGFHVLGVDINPMAYWIVRQALGHLDREEFARAANDVVADVERIVGDLYQTSCASCGASAGVKYFLWVKTAQCPHCSTENDLFPGYLLAEAVRHPRHVLACPTCGELNEYVTQPTRTKPARCRTCTGKVHIEGPARRQRFACRSCAAQVPFASGIAHPPRHRLWAVEYHCAACKPLQEGRFFKKPDADDLDRFLAARRRLEESVDLPIPDDEIPTGDETDRLHRWGYRRYREMFNERQLFGLGTLLLRIQREPTSAIRHALLTVFSDFLRYQNLLCRYDTYALKCQDIFSVHGFPVGLVQCENNLLGIPRVGSGAFRHFIEKYLRAKDYCEHPFETRATPKGKQIVPIVGERIAAEFTKRFPRGKRRKAWLRADSAAEMSLPPASLDGVFTDPPYFNNVQYAELMDFCFVWLRQALRDELPEFRKKTTRTANELTGNATLGRGVEHFTDGLARVFCNYGRALKPGAPFVFTYHHNDPAAYLPIVVAILDAALTCTATLPAAAEMGASLHIAGTNSSVLDTVFVCRAWAGRPPVAAFCSTPADLVCTLTQDAGLMEKAGVKVTAGDLRCLAAGHIARIAVGQLAPGWKVSDSLEDRMALARETLTRCERNLQPDIAIASIVNDRQPPSEPRHAAAL